MNTNPHNHPGHGRMKRNGRSLRAWLAAGLTGLGGLALAGGGIGLAPPLAEATSSGKSLVVPKELAARGTVYHALTGRDRQIFFTSDAPLEQIKGQSNRVIGFAVAGSSANPAALAGGEWHLPVDSLRTGIDLRDEHLAGESWLDAEANPVIAFQLERVDGAEESRRTDAYTSYTGTLIGEMTIHGVTRAISIPESSITFLKASDKTKKIAEGDLLAIRAKYTVKLSDYGVSHPVIGDKVANEVKISTTLYLATVAPESQPEVSDD